VILVTGATGNVGSQVVRELRGMGVNVRAFVRDRHRATEKLGDDVELALGDFGDAASVQRAVEGADAVFLSSADSPQKVEHETGVIDAAVEAGVRRIVKASTLGAEPGSPLPPFDWNGRSEEHLRRTSVGHVVLQSSFYMTNLFAAAEPIRHTSRLFAPSGEGRVAMIDPRDVAAVAAVVLTGDGHDGETYTLTGPAAISYGDVADALSGATGKQVDYVDVPDEAARQGLVEAGLPDWLVAHLGQLFPLIRDGAFEQTTDMVRELTGRNPRTFADFAQEHAAAFR